MSILQNVTTIARPSYPPSLLSEQLRRDSATAEVIQVTPHQLNRLHRLIKKVITICGLCSLLVVGTSLAFYNDLELSPTNVIASGSLDVTMTSPTDNFEPTHITPGQTSQRTVTIANAGTMPFFFDLNSDPTTGTGETALCQALQLTIHQDLPSATDPLLYSGLLHDFTGLPTPHQLQPTDLAQNFIVSFSLPALTEPDLQNQSCAFALTASAWQSDQIKGWGGFTDTEQLESSIETDEWQLSDVTVCKEDEYGNRLAGWMIQLRQGEELIDEAATETNGCVTFSNIEYGNYQLDEVVPTPPEGTQWTNISGLGSVMINAAIENFTIVNRQDLLTSVTLSGVKKNASNNEGLSNWPILIHDTDRQPLQTLLLNSQDSDGEQTQQLDTGKTYLIEVSGTWTNFNGAQLVDAEFTSTDAWVTQLNPDSQAVTDPRFLDVVINDQDVSWGSFNTPHLYKTVVNGNDQPITLKISEAGDPNPPNGYNDNEGLLHIKIYDVTDEIVLTNASGEYAKTLTAASEYQIIEVLQPSWLQAQPSSPASYYDVTLPLAEGKVATGYDFVNQSAIVLNEILFNPIGNEYAHMPLGEWVELYNLSTQPIDVSGWKIKDATATPKTISVANSDNNLNYSDSGETIVPAKGYLTVYLNDSYLNNSGVEEVSLIDPKNVVRDKISYKFSSAGTDGKTVINVAGKAEGHTLARVPDGTGSWIDPVATPGRANVEDTNELQPSITLWQQDDQHLTVGIFDAINYHTAEITVNYQRDEYGQTVPDHFEKVATIITNTQYVPDLFFGTESDGVLYPHTGMQQIEIEVILKGNGLPDRKIMKEFEGEWQEEILSQN